MYLTAIAYNPANGYPYVGWYSPLDKNMSQWNPNATRSAYLSIYIPNHIQADSLGEYLDSLDLHNDPAVTVLRETEGWS